jgi:DNA-binding MarR family transcriptional regulator
MVRAARTAYRARREREKAFGANLFADPAWDLLLYLFLAADDERAVTVTEACYAASVPTSTALRCVGHLVDRKLILRVANAKDRRTAHLYLSSLGREKMTAFLTQFQGSAETATL